MNAEEWQRNFPELVKDWLFLWAEVDTDPQSGCRRVTVFVERKKP